jgi:hypothetical protein
MASNQADFAIASRPKQPQNDVNNLPAIRLSLS